MMKHETITIPTHLTTFQQEIESAVNKKVSLKINDNHSTMLSVKWEPECTKVSMHRMFLEAPDNIMTALACHIMEENSAVSPTVRSYIEEKLRTLDYSKQSDKGKFITKGRFYDLEELYNEINSEYFNNSLDLSITWFGNASQRKRSRVTFGLYYDPLKLIKIHRILDKARRFKNEPYFPDFFIKYVIYHEMLHHVCPAYYDDYGKHRIHTVEFKKEEKRFREFEQAQVWMKEHFDNFFMM